MDQLTRANRQISTLQRLVSASGSRNKTVLPNHIRSTRQRSRTLEKEVQQLQTHLTNKTREFTSLHDAHQKLLLDHATAVEQLQVNKRLVEDWQRNYTQASMKVEEITAQLKQESASHTEKVERLEQHANGLEKSYADALETVSTSEHALKMKDLRIAQLEQENLTLQEHAKQQDKDLLRLSSQLRLAQLSPVPTSHSDPDLAASLTSSSGPTPSPPASALSSPRRRSNRLSMGILDVLQRFGSNPEQETEQLLTAIEKLREANHAHKAQNAMLTRELRNKERDSESMLQLHKAELDELRKEVIALRAEKLAIEESRLTGAGLKKSFLDEVEHMRKEFFHALCLSIKLDLALRGTAYNGDLRLLYDVAKKQHYSTWHRLLTEAVKRDEDKKRQKEERQAIKLKDRSGTQPVRVRSTVRTRANRIQTQ